MQALVNDTTKDSLMFHHYGSNPIIIVIDPLDPQWKSKPNGKPEYRVTSHLLNHATSYVPRDLLKAFQFVVGGSEFDTSVFPAVDFVKRIKPHNEWICREDGRSLDVVLSEDKNVSKLLSRGDL